MYGNDQDIPSRRLQANQSYDDELDFTGGRAYRKTGLQSYSRTFDPNEWVILQNQSYLTMTPGTWCNEDPNPKPSNPWY